MSTGAALVGGVFGLARASPTATAPPWGDAPHLALMVNARSCLQHALTASGTTRVWLPSYLCPALLAGARGDGREVRWFAVTATLDVEEREWLGDVRRSDAVVLIDYFGFPTDPALVAALRATGALVIRDAAQALLTPASSSYDAEISSPRKFVGVPDGGVLVWSDAARISPPHLRDADRSWRETALAATERRRAFDEQGADRSWFELFQRSEAGAPTGPLAMSERARALLRDGIDYPSTAALRRRNYQALAEAVGELALRPALPAGAVPLGFPVAVADRDRVRRQLFDADVYPPVHWPLSGVVPERYAASHRLSRSVLTLVCDQRYDVDDMLRQAALVRAAL